MVSESFESLGVSGITHDRLSGLLSSDDDWEQCDRGDWMMYCVGLDSESPSRVLREKLVLCACECVESYSESTELLEACKLWAKGEGFIGSVKRLRWPLEDLSDCLLPVSEFTIRNCAADSVAGVVLAPSHVAGCMKGAVRTVRARQVAAGVVRDHFPCLPTYWRDYGDVISNLDTRTVLGED